MTHAPGRSFLLAAGILYIVFGGLGILTSAGMLATVEYWNVLMPTETGMPVRVAALWNTYYTIAIVGSVFQLFIGIMGAANGNRPEKASLLRRLGIAGIGCVVLGTVFGTILGAVIFTGALAGGMAVFNLAIGLILPVLYIIGAQKNISAYSGGQPPQG